MGGAVRGAKRARLPRLRAYQCEAGRAVLTSVYARAGRSFSIQVARQGGKNELSAQIELLLLMSGHGGDIAIKCAPTLRPQLQVSRRRLWARVGDAGLRGIARFEPDAVRLGDAAVRFLSAELAAHVVGHTAGQLLEADEAQDVDAEKFDREFRPMAASTNATTVYYGTPWDASTLLERAKQTHLEAERGDGVRRHFEYDWQRVAECVPAYGSFVESERQRLGATHPVYLTQYCLQLIAGGGRLLSAGQRAQLAGAHDRRAQPASGEVYVAGLDLAGGDDGPSPDGPSPPTPLPQGERGDAQPGAAVSHRTDAQPGAAVSHRTDAQPGAAVPHRAEDVQPGAAATDQVEGAQPGAAVPHGTDAQPGAAVPHGTDAQLGAAVPHRADAQPGAAVPHGADAQPGAAVPHRRDSTVLTIGRLVQPGADAMVDEPRVEIVEHYAWCGEPHETLLPRLIDLLRDVWRVTRVAVDATGIGETTSRLLARALGESRVEAVKFSAERKSQLGFGLLAAINGGRLKMYRGDGSLEQRTFWREMELAKSAYRANRTMNFFVEPREGHDDYLMSAALVVEASKGAGPRVATGRVARRSAGASRGSQVVAW